jgi:hypothetical protein
MHARRMLSLGLLALLLAGSACQGKPASGFSMYLLAAHLSAAEAAGMDLDEVELESQPLLSTADILAYDQGTHTLELTREAFNRLQADLHVPMDGLPFVVCAGGERIYPGAFWSPVSSLSYDGVVILLPLDTASTTLQISLGYPAAPFFSGSDPRADPRVLEALEDAGLLRAENGEEP